MLDIISKNNTKKWFKFFQKIRKTVQVMAYLRVLYWEDAYVKANDFGQKDFANGPKFVLQ